MHMNINQDRYKLLNIKNCLKINFWKCVMFQVQDITQKNYSTPKFCRIFNMISIITYLSVKSPYLELHYIIAFMEFQM